MPAKGLDFLNTLNPSSLLPFYYLYGERYLVEKCVEKIVEGVLPIPYRKMDLEVYHPDTDPRTIIDSALTIPFLSPKKVIVVKDVHLFSSSELDLFIPYMERPSPHTILLFIGEGIDMRKRFYIFIEKKGGIVEFTSLKGQALLSWLRKGFEKMGLTITPPALELLIEMVGEDLQALSKEMEKIGNFCSGKGRVDVADIEAITPSIKPARIFDFVDSLGEGNARKTLKILKGLVEEGEAPLKILNLMIRHFRILWMLRLCGISEVKRRFRIPQTFFNRYERESRRFSPATLEGIYGRLVAIDRAIKKGLLPEREALENLTLDLLLFLRGGGEEGIHPSGKPRYLS